MPVLRFALLLSLLVPCLAHADASGKIAVLVGEEQEVQQVRVYDLATQQLTPVGPGRRDGAPQWSPDGTQLAFHTEQDGKLGIYVVAADGSGGRRLAHAHDWSESPRWSPDGTRIAYTVGIDEGPVTGVAVYDLASNTETMWGGAQAGLLRPVFLPSMLLLLALQPEARDKAFSDPVAEGLRQQAFAADSPGALLTLGFVGGEGKLSTEIFIATPGFAVPVLSQVPGAEDSLRYAEWYAEPNPKGERLAYESNDGGDREIYVIGKRGLSNVSNHNAADWAPTWSPDGRSIAFESFRSGRRGVYRVFTDTARVLPVHVLADSDAWGPSWSPDGKAIACVDQAKGQPGVVVVNLRDNTARPLAIDAPNEAPAWQPKAKAKK